MRGIALNPTSIFARGMVVQKDGTGLIVPIGKEILGRMFVAFGNTIDYLEPLQDMQKRNVHQSPSTLANRDNIY